MAKNLPAKILILTIVCLCGSLATNETLTTPDSILLRDFLLEYHAGELSAQDKDESSCSKYTRGESVIHRCARNCCDLSLIYRCGLCERKVVGGRFTTNCVCYKPETKPEVSKPEVSKPEEWKPLWEPKEKKPAKPLCIAMPRHE